jgi:ribosomal protein L40E
VSQRTRIIEGTWTCTSCRKTGIPGREKTCPACGNPRDEKAETEFDFGVGASPSGASAHETVTDAALLAKAQAGADWFCAFCGAGNPADAQLCRTCSAPRTERPPAGAAPPVPAAVAAAPPGRGRRWALGGCGLVILLVALFLAFGAWGSRAREVEGRVVSRSWHREAVRERFVRVTREGWQDEIAPRRTVLPVRGIGEVAGVEGVRDCARRQRGTRQVAAGRETVCEDRTRSVQCGTEQRCTTRDLGNGFAEEVCEDVPKYCDESYRDCREETRYRDEPVYGTLCRYDTWEWQSAGKLEESGAEEPPRWPSMALGSMEREQRTERYDVVLEYQHRGETHQHVLHPANESELAQWPAGRTATLTVSNFGEVKEVRAGD